MDNKMTKVGTGHTGEIIIADATGNALASGVTIGSATMKSSPNHNTVATEKAISGYISDNAVLKNSVATSSALAGSIDTASDEKVITEKGLFTLIERVTDSIESRMAENMTF